MTAALTAHGLSARRGDFLLQPVSFSLDAGEAMLAFGPSQAGKSTLLRSLAGLLPATGEVSIAGTPLFDGEAEVSPEAQRGIGVVFQGEALFDSMTVLENVTLPLLRRGVARREAELRARTCLDEVGLTEAADRLPEQLSGGMRKRAALARALAPSSPLLLIDDPLAGLVPATSLRIVELLTRVRSAGPAMVLFSADPAPLWPLATQAMAMESGRTVAQGSPPQVREQTHALLEAT